ncbi:MAG: hybrid sensor histidine kinase/response regulator [Rhodanobacter sp.]|nr:MAG: hybrid sensor histidine kinase/response regulator [Rhodanobacter sp.]
MFGRWVRNAVSALCSLGVGVGAIATPRDLPMAPAHRVAVATTALQTPQFRRYGVVDGLPSGTVYAMAQDRHGLIWSATASGLVRYDGVGFEVFRHALDDPHSIPAGALYALFVDRDDRVWAGGLSNGLIRYRQTDGRFSQWLHDDKNPASLASNEVWSIAQTPDGELWVATDAGLDRMRKDGRGFDHLPLRIGDTHAASFGPVRALLAEPDGRLWIGTEHGIYLRQADGTIHRVPVASAFHGNLGKIWRIDGSHGETRIACDGGLLVVGADGVARPLDSRKLVGRRIVSSTRDRHGRLWIGTTDGLLLDDGDGRLQTIVGQPLLPGGLPGNMIWQTMLDREGGLWITFDESSVAYLPPGWDGFSRFTHIPDDPASLSNIGASTILTSRDGQLWVGGENGWIDRLDVTTGRVQHVVHGVRGQVVSLAEDARGRLWIAIPGGLQVFDHGKLRSVDLARAGITRPVLLSSADDGRIYVVSWGEGMFAINPDSLAITAVPMERASDTTRTPEQLAFNKGNLWYASKGGLFRLDRHTGKLVFVDGVPRQEILVFACDADGFWIATHRMLTRYRYADGKATRVDAIDISHRQFAADITALHVDRAGQLWVFANPGLWRLDEHRRHFESFGPAQGLSNTEFSSGDAAVTSNGMVFAPNTGGVVGFQPGRLLHPDAARRVAPLLTLTGVTVRRHGKTRSLPLNGKPVQLGWRDRDLGVQVRLASYIHPAANHYRFLLHDFDSDWVDVGARGQRDFAGLSAGTYTLDIEAAGVDGVWGSLASPLTIDVQAPPWARWWAWLGYLLLLVSVTALAMASWRRRMAQRHRLQLAEQQRQLAEAASAAKTQFLATLSHEIRTPMTGVMGMAELLLSTPLSPLQHDYTRAMQRSGGMLLKLLNDALDLARIEAGRLELEPAPFDPAQLVSEVAELEQGLARAKGLDFLLELDDALPSRVVGDALRIKQVLLNLANNALKFTDRGRVILRVRRRRHGQGLLFSVSDTGPGIPEASQERLFRRFEQEQGPQRSAGSGLGLAICRELVDMMGGSIELESRPGHGTTFRVRLPLSEPPTASMALALAKNQPYRLLLVEDDTIVAAVIRGLLERQGHAVCHVVNGLAALAELAHGHFDALLLDLDLPGVDGFQIARLIRQREHAGQRLPIIAVTARSAGEDEAYAAGMDSFLRKPLSGEQLAGALACVVAVLPEPAVIT